MRTDGESCTAQPVDVSLFPAQPVDVDIEEGGGSWWLYQIIVSNTINSNTNDGGTMVMVVALMLHLGRLLGPFPCRGQLFTFQAAAFLFCCHHRNK